MNNEQKNIFKIVYGSILPNLKSTSFKSLIVKDDELKVVWFSKEYVIQNFESIAKITRIIEKNADKLIYFTDKQTAKIEEFSSRNLIIGSYEDECYGLINNMKISVCNRFNNKELNEFYEQFRNKLFDEVDKIISENKCIDLEIVPVNTKTKKCPKCQSPLKKYIYGLVTSDFDEKKYIIGGCEDYMDNPIYHCEKCNYDYDNKLKLLK